MSFSLTPTSFSFTVLGRVPFPAAEHRCPLAWSRDFIFGAPRVLTRSSVTIHPLDIFLRVIFITPSLIAPSMEDDPWFGSATRPNTTVDLKELKTFSANGTRAVFRKGPAVIWPRQGPDDHVIALEDDTIDLYRKINRYKSIFLIKSGESHQSYASIDSYKYSSPAPSPCTTTSLAHASFVATTLTTSGASALSYGGGVILAQSIWWAARHIRWIRHPVMVQITIAIALLAGVTPTVIADAIFALSAPAVRYVWTWVSSISASWLGGPWLWLFPLMFALVWWFRYAGSPSFLSESEDSPVCARGGKSRVSPALSPTPPPFQQVVLSSASRIWCHGDATKSLISDPCAEVAAFHIHLSDGDCLAPVLPSVDTLGYSQSACPVCLKHVSLYQQHVRLCVRRVPQCVRIGHPLTLGSELVYECLEDGEERIISDKIPTALHTRTSKPSVKSQSKEEPSSPPMPAPGPMDSPSPIPARESTPSGTVATGVSMGNFRANSKNWAGGRLLIRLLRPSLFPLH